MRKSTLSVIAVSLGLTAAVLLTTPAIAAVRSTPVEVISPIEIAPSANTVKAQQLGLWTMTVSGTAAVTQSGAWNVGIIGTPNVSVSNTVGANIQNTPTVRIDASANTVKTPTQSNSIQLWTSELIVEPSKVAYGPTINCAGYKELRIYAASTVNSDSVWLYVRFRSPSGSWVSVGAGNFTVPSVSISEHANFRPATYACIMTLPVMSDMADVYVYNGTASSATIKSLSWAYLVN